VAALPTNAVFQDRVSEPAGLLTGCLTLVLGMRFLALGLIVTSFALLGLTDLHTAAWPSPLWSQRSPRPVLSPSRGERGTSAHPDGSTQE
jgi:hypothetical protein